MSWFPRKSVFIVRILASLSVLGIASPPVSAIDLNRIARVLKARPITAKCERTLARIESRIERKWWKGLPHFKNADDLQIALARNQLEVARPIQGVRYSENMKYHLARPETFDLLDESAIAFRAELRSQQLDPTKVDLVVTSMVRTLEYQKALIARGLPASKSSSHTLGVAVDISYGWLEKFEPRYANALETILQRRAETGLVNVVRERQQGVWHIGMHPALFQHGPVR